MKSHQNHGFSSSKISSSKEAIFLVRKLKKSTSMLALSEGMFWKQNAQKCHFTLQIFIFNFQSFGRFHVRVSVLWVTLTSWIRVKFTEPPFNLTLKQCFCFIELARNREFYRTHDVRPPFTYVDMIRQVVKNANLFAKNAKYLHQVGYINLWKLPI